MNNSALSKFIKKRRFISFKKNKSNKFYTLWQSIRQRCTNKNNPAYKHYGGRGIGFLITIEDLIRLWYHDKAYLMETPSIDRIDNNGHYVFENCRFIELSKNISKGNKERKFRKILVDNKLQK